jgi:hypothetical protein
MCFMLCLGARVAPPSAAYGGKGGNGTVHIEVLSEHDSALRAHFTLPHVVYVASEQGCGCGFRHTSFQGFWPDESIVSDLAYTTQWTQANHEGLVLLLREHFWREAFIELYGYWAEDDALTEIDRREVNLADLSKPGFHFHQRGFCRVTLAGALDAPGKLLEPEAQCRAVLAEQERLLGPEHPDTLGIRHNLAGTLLTQGKHAEAEGIFRQAIPFFERVLGPEHPDTQQARASLASALNAQGKLTSDK